MLLGLNCGFGRMEIGTLYTKEIVGNYIKRVRRKTKVYGEWRLWPETKKAIEWYMRRRPDSSLPEVVLSRNGKPLHSTDSGNDRSDISAVWYRFLDRIAADESIPNHAEYAKGGSRRLPFNKLRKTSGNWIRRIEDGETMKIFHSRGKPVQNDEHSEAYSNKPFRRVFKAIRIMGKKLAFLKGEWPDKVPQPITGQGKINRCQELRRQDSQDR